MEDIAWVRLTGARSAVVHVEAFKAIRRQQLKQRVHQETKADVAFVLELEAKLQTKHDVLIEVDQVPHGVYRVWSGVELIGTFYQYQGHWIAEPAHGRIYQCRTLAEAQRAIIQTHSKLT